MNTNNLQNIPLNNRDEMGGQSVGSNLGADSASNAIVAKNGIGFKRIMVFFILIVILLIGSIAFYYFFRYNGYKSQSSGDMGAPKILADTNSVNFYDLPEFIVNIDNDAEDVSYIRLELSLEVMGFDNMQRVRQLEPKIQDILNIYLRELRLSDIKGTYGLYRLREELFNRINAVLAPAKIDGVIFKLIRTQ
jgi:flagellar FliL protein